MSATPTRPPGPLLALALTIASSLAVFFWWVAVSRRLPLGATLIVAMLGGRLAFALLAPRVASLRETLALRRPSARDLALGVVLALIVAPVQALQGLLLGSRLDAASNPFVVPVPHGAPATGTGLALAFLAFGLVEPIATELLFRGWLQGTLVARWGRWRGLLATSALFAVAYAGLAGFGRAALAAALSGLLYGLAFGWAREGSGSTWTAVLAHGLAGAAWVAARVA